MARDAEPGDAERGGSSWRTCRRPTRRFGRTCRPAARRFGRTRQSRLFSADWRAWLFSADRRAQRFGRARRTGQDARGGPGAAGAMARPGGGDGDGRCRSERWSDGRGEGIRCQAREPSQPERSGSVRRISTAQPNPHIGRIFSWSQPNLLLTSIQTARKQVQPSWVGSSTSTKHTVRALPLLETTYSFYTY